MLVKKRGRPSKKVNNLSITQEKTGTPSNTLAQKIVDQKISKIQSKDSLLQTEPRTRGKKLEAVVKKPSKIQTPEANASNQSSQKSIQASKKNLKKIKINKSTVKINELSEQTVQKQIQSKLQKNVNIKKTKSSSKEIQEQNYENPSSNKYQLSEYNSERPSRLRKSKINLTEQYQSEASDQKQQLTYQQANANLLNPKIEYLIWKTNDEDQRYLAKFYNRSYLHCKWFKKDELKQINFQFTHSVLKSLNARMRKTMHMKLKQNVHYNPNFVKVDRILSSAEMITTVNHKITNQIKGHWSQSIFLVCSKLLNFYKNEYAYCLHLYDALEQQVDGQIKLVNSVYLGQVFNKVSLLKYKSYKQFWADIGTAINSFRAAYNIPQSDLIKIAESLKQAAIFLYFQWFYLCLKRFKTVRRELINGKIIEQNSLKQFEQAKVYENFKFNVQNEIIDFEQTFCKDNILINSNFAQLPNDQAQLKLLYPGQPNLDWLQLQIPAQNAVYTLNHLNLMDLHQLDINSEIKRLFLIKWKDLSYKEMSWQTEDVIQNKQKIEQFYNFNKYPPGQIQKQLLKQIKIHLALLEYYEKNEKIGETKTEKLCRIQNQLYILTVKQERKQYGNENIPIFKNYRQLKQFQLQSLNWMIRNWHQNRNFILADQMGLGKTIQTIAFLYHLYTYQKVLGPFLIIAPLTTLHQWRKQIEDWTNFNCLLYYDEGSSEIRELIRNFQFYHMSITKTSQLKSTQIPKFQILLTSYQLFLKDFQILKLIAFQHIVLDQAHKLKNKNSKITATLNKLPCCRKTLLTGTPIQNNTKQLWTLLNFIEPQKFDSDQQFQAKYGRLESQQQVKQFRTILKPYLLRRIKEDVQTTIPKLSELIISVQMTNEQKKYYRGLVEKNKNQMIKGLSNANFNSISIQLRKCCNHPYLIAPEIESQLKKNCKTLQEENQIFMKSSGKIILLLKLLEKFKKEGKKVLVFSQFVMMLDLMKPFLESYSFNCEILKGSQTSTIRHQAITRFNQQSQKTDVFLISTKAGGIGINLISASEVIIYDSDWNPQNDIQATARAHRIGQKKEVTVYRLITASSYESQMFKISSKKLGLDKAVFTGQFFKSSNANAIDDSKLMSKDQIQTLLKKGIIGFLQNEKDNEEYFNQSIEDILEKNTKRIQYNTTQTTFSKTTFRAEEKDGININDPDFWEVALKNVQTSVDKILKKLPDLKEFDTIQKQQELLVEAYHICYLFVKQKTLNSGFNAQDQFKLHKFFRAIQNQRHFHKKFRQICSDFIEQIQKPSRRFRVKIEDLYITKPNIKQGAQQQKEMEQEEGSDTEQIPEKMDEQVKFQLKKQKESRQIEQDSNLMQVFQKFCYNCWRPKCIFFCKGPCGRGFHKKCWQKFEKGDHQRTPIFDIVQKSLPYQNWKSQINLNQLCRDCRNENFKFQCGICLNKGTYDLMINNNKEKYKKFSNDLSSQMIFKCNMRNCNKFFHLRCLYSQAYQGRFADKAGKVVKNIKDRCIIFRCPAHYCFSCYGKDVQFSKSRPITCALCSLTYHLKCMSQNQYIKVRRSTYVCSRHLDKKLQIFLKEELKLFVENRQGQRKHNKESKIQKQSIQSRIMKLKQKRDEALEHKQVNNPDQLQKPKLNQTQGKQKKSIFKHSYRDFGLTSISQFDFSGYKGDWCRYCGSRFSNAFKKGPWGNRKLCYHHYVSWKKNRLDLSKYKNKQPSEPIDKSRDTEIKYLNLMQEQLSLKPMQAVLKLKEMMFEQKERAETKRQSKKQNSQNYAKDQNQERFQQKQEQHRQLQQANNNKVEGQIKNEENADLNFSTNEANASGEQNNEKPNFQINKEIMQGVLAIEDCKQIDQVKHTQKSLIYANSILNISNTQLQQDNTFPLCHFLFPDNEQEEIKEAIEELEMEIIEASKAQKRRQGK